ncbi:MAG: hypothetical protein IH960_02655 [Chloroflexi bacterium]|nr:hypothetical protein [Chloroflexota bacterium]MCH8910969.1 hypothetical protein [Chloroflexota bacterium]
MARLAHLDSPVTRAHRVRLVRLVLPVNLVTQVMLEILARPVLLVSLVSLVTRAPLVKPEMVRQAPQAPRVIAVLMAPLR